MKVQVEYALSRAGAAVGDHAEVGQPLLRGHQPADVQQMTDELLKLYAEREMIQGQS